MLRMLAAGVAVSLSVGAAVLGSPTHAATPVQNSDDSKARWGVIERYCLECHNVTDWAGGVAFDTMSFDSLADDAKVWESAVRKLRAGFMPPPGAKERPDVQTVSSLIRYLETHLDSAQVEPPPGRVPLRRLNRREYANAVRDLIGLNADVAALLPADDQKGGFDNTATHLQVSPSFLDQYLSAARQIALQAVGDPQALPITTTYGNAGDMVIALAAKGNVGAGAQQLHKEGMPFGTRGGISYEHTFPADGEYVLTIGDLAEGRLVPRMEFSNTVIALLDGKEIYRTQIGGEADQKDIDQRQETAVGEINERLRNIRFRATAGQHRIAVTFLKRSYIESEERFRSDPPEGGEERLQAVNVLQIRGPVRVDGVSDSPSRQKIFICRPAQASEEAACAQKIIRTLAQRAFRRPADEQRLRPLLAFYENGRKDGGFDAGVRDALSGILASPYFLYRIEGGEKTGGTRTLTDLELASRLSFFIWSSIPDDELLGLAMRSELGKSEVLERQVRRMLADPKAESLTTGFGFQWLNLARLDEIEPSRALFPHASGVLDPRPLYRRELELFVDSVLRSEQPVTALLTADYTYLNETLAMLYGIDTVKGGQFRRVTLPDSKRYGLLGKSAVLMLTANPDRTAPVLRGAWILDRILGTPPAQPPPGADNLEEKPRAQPATMRERMEQHAANPTCHSCHGVLDPLGFALENFDTIGQFRIVDSATRAPVDTTGTLPDGTRLSGPDDLRRALTSRPVEFTQALTERLMTYALGRNVDHRDMPTVRRIVRNAAQDGYRFASIVTQIAASDAFRKREPAPAAQVTTASATHSTHSDKARGQ